MVWLALLLQQELGFAIVVQRHCALSSTLNVMVIRFEVLDRLQPAVRVGWERPRCCTQPNGLLLE
jgi:hypothetical protein